MCGIAGVLKFNGEPLDSYLLKQMTDTLIHRGPDADGIWIAEEQNIGFGHRRLSIVDLTDAGNQPMHYANQRYTITYNGEIYNYVELKNDLEKKGYKFFSETDTEVLLALYDYKKETCLEDLDGMFAFAIWDSLERELFCARDRFGEKPFFYYKDSKQFVFASEIKALWKAGIQKQVSPRRIYEYLMFNTTESHTNVNETFYDNILSIEQSGFMLIRSNGEIKRNKYWEIDLNHRNRSISFDEACEKLNDGLMSSVKKRLRSDVDVGSSLSGGLDSSSISALVMHNPDHEAKFKVFSARFKDFEKDEGEYIDLMVDKYPRLDLTEVYPSPESLEKRFDRIVYYQDEPFGSLSIAAQFEVFEKAKRSGVSVLLDGQGADEYLAGYKQLFEIYYYQLHKTNRSLYKSEIKEYLIRFSSVFKSPSFLDIINYRNKKFFDFITNQRRKYIDKEHPYFLNIHPDIVQQYKKNDNPLSRHVTLREQLHYATTRSGLSSLLRYSDRNSMANSIEVRLPFLDHKLVEFAFSLPESFLISNAWSKYILRKSMEKYLPENICWRTNKIGFATPQDDLINSTFFKDKRSDAITKLVSSGIITKSNDKLDWSYIMLAEYLK